MTKTLLEVIFIMGLAMVLAIVACDLVLLVWKGSAPAQLDRWTDMSIGFVFGTLSALAKSWSDKQ